MLHVTQFDNIREEFLAKMLQQYRKRLMQLDEEDLEQQRVEGKNRAIAAFRASVC